ncbi:MAG: hypothetical protein SF339_20900, partial [Blastocatellia bacterium]|nr:hypothetical protein [Blastocatellia bacterium]
ARFVVTVGGYSASSLPASGRHRKHQNKEFLQPPCLNLKIQGGTPNDFIALGKCTRPGCMCQKKKNGTNGKDGTNGALQSQAPFVPLFPFVPFFFFLIADQVACI